MHGGVGEVVAAHAIYKKYQSRGSHRKMYTVKSDSIFLTGPRADA